MLIYFTKIYFAKKLKYYEIKSKVHPFCAYFQVVDCPKQEIYKILNIHKIIDAD